MTNLEATNLMYELSKLNAEEERALFSLLRGTLSEEEILSTILGASTLRLMANGDLKHDMGKAMFEFFVSTSAEKERR